MNVNATARPSFPLPSPTREEMIAVAMTRPAVLQQQMVALAAHDSGTSGQGTPAVDGDSGVDLYA